MLCYTAMEYKLGAVLGILIDGDKCRGLTVAGMRRVIELQL